jgi:branched-chain amino acid transport system substrate-binding protein
VLTLGLFGCEPASVAPPAPPDTVRIVSSLPEKGYAAPPSKLIEQAIDLAIEQRSASAGAWHVEHLALNNSDDETGDWSYTKELANAQQAVNDPSVIAYIGPYNSGAAMLSLPITNRAGLLQASLSATWPGLTQPGWNEGEPDFYYPSGKRNFARMMPPDNVQANAAVQWALETHASHVAALTDGSSYSLGLAQQFEKAASSHAGLASAKIAITPPNLQGLRIQLAAYTAVFYAPSTVTNAVAVAKALQGTNITVFASDTALDPQFAAEADGAQNWRILSNSADLAGLPAFQSFAQSFKARYGTAPTQFAANAYDITNLILDNLATKGNNRDAITAAVLATAAYDGASGPVAFDPATGDRTNWRMSGYRLVNGTFKLDATFESPPTR